METIKTYMLHWYGPFSNKDQVACWENEHKGYTCNLYLLSGFKKSAKFKLSYYCGKTEQGVAKRLSSPTHHIHSYREVREIWIGCFRNVNAESRDIFDTENILTAYLADEVGQKQMLNQINMRFPAYQVCVINRWYKPDMNPRYRLDSQSPSKYLPDMLLHYYSDGVHLIYGSEKLKRLKISF